MKYQLERSSFRGCTGSLETRFHTSEEAPADSVGLLDALERSRFVTSLIRHRRFYSVPNS
jgi:hypothetical protein